MCSMHFTVGSEKVMYQLMYATVKYKIANKTAL